MLTDAPAAPTPPRDRLLKLSEHLDELRRRLLLCFGALVVAAGVSFTQVERIIGWLKHPAQPQLLHFAFFSPAEPLAAYLKVALMAGITVTMPLLLGQLWAFIRPALSPRERALGLGFIGWGSASFAAGVAFAYGVLLPLSLRVLLGLGGEQLVPVISIDRYLSFVTTLLFWCGVLFELPAVLVLLAKVGIVTAEWLRQQRPYAILGIIVLAALATPTTDVMTLLLLALPLLGLYELSIVLTRRVLDT